MKSRSSEMRRARPLLGTLVEIGAEGENAASAIDAAFDEIALVHRLMSFHEAASDVSRLNRAPLGTPVEVDPRTYEVLAWAQRMSALSGRAFDVTVGARLVAAGFLPAPDAEGPSGKTSFRDVRLLRDHRVSLRRRVWIDLGGIAKGYAVDRAIATLKRNGVECGIVNAGGDLRVFGAPQPIHLRHPEDPARLLFLGQLSDTAIASSSGCFTERSKENDRPDPLVDPRHKTAIRWQQSVTVIAPRCVVADALTKIVRIAPRRAARILPELDAEAIVIDRRGARRLAAAVGEARADRVIGAAP
jgi:thiamine biosynthesis lipoprotein